MKDFFLALALVVAALLIWGPRLPRSAPRPVEATKATAPTSLERRSTPAGTYVVTKRISATMEWSVVGFAPGTVVTIKQESPLIVSDGINQLPARADQITNDLSVAESFLKPATDAIEEKTKKQNEQDQTRALVAFEPPQPQYVMTEPSHSPVEAAKPAPFPQQKQQARVVSQSQPVYSLPYRTPSISQVRTVSTTLQRPPLIIQPSLNSSAQHCPGSTPSLGDSARKVNYRLIWQPGWPETLYPYSR